MESLIQSSLKILRNADNITAAYGWMDVGDLMSEKLRSGKTLEGEMLLLSNKLADIINNIELEEDIVLYRGINGQFDSSLAEKQYNAMSPRLDTAKSYGDYIIKVIVPRGANALYISAWEILNPEVDENEEKEVVLAPGSFHFLGEEDGITIYKYKQA